MVFYQASLNTYKKTELTPCNLTDHHGLDLGINTRSNRNLRNSQKRSLSLMDKKWAKMEFKKGIKDFLEENGNECATYPNTWGTVRAF